MRNVYLGHTTGLGSGHCRGYVGEPFFDQLPTCFPEHDDRDLAMSQVLLMSDVSVCRDEYIESGRFRAVRQFGVLQRVPSTSPRLFDGVIGERRGNTSRSPIVEENAHQRRAAGASRFRAANSSTALTCSRVRGNCSITSSSVIPSSRFSKTTATGVRVPLNTQAPLTLPGTLSTAEHSDQSRAAMDDLLQTPAYGISVVASFEVRPRFG